MGTNYIAILHLLTMNYTFEQKTKNEWSRHFQGETLAPPTSSSNIRNYKNHNFSSEMSSCRSIILGLVHAKVNKKK